MTRPEQVDDVLDLMWDFFASGQYVDDDGAEFLDQILDVLNARELKKGSGDRIVTVNVSAVGDEKAAYYTVAQRCGP